MCPIVDMLSAFKWFEHRYKSLVQARVDHADKQLCPAFNSFYAGVKGMQ